MSTVPVSDANEFPFWRRFLGILVGFIVGVMVVALIEGLSLKNHPFPSDDQEAMQTFMEGLPIKALVLVLVAHGAGSFIAGFGCTAIAGRKWYLGAGIVGGIILLCGILNLMNLPHPVWFVVIDVILYVPFALVGCTVASETLKMK